MSKVTVASREVCERLCVMTVSDKYVWGVFSLSSVCMIYTQSFIWAPYVASPGYHMCVCVMQLGIVVCMCII